MNFGARQNQRHPICRLVEAFGGVINVRSTVEDLPNFGKRPFAGDGAAVAGMPRLAPFCGNAIQSLCLSNGGMVLPKLHVCLRLVLKFGEDAEGGAVLQGGEHGAGGKIDSNRNHLGRVHLSFRQNGRNDSLQHLHVVQRMLKRRIGRERCAVGKGRFHNGVRVIQHRRGDLPPRIAVHQNGAPRKGSKINSDHISFHIYSSHQRSLRHRYCRVRRFQV